MSRSRTAAVNAAGQGERAVGPYALGVTAEMPALTVVRLASGPTRTTMVPAAVMEVTGGLRNRWAAVIAAP